MNRRKKIEGKLSAGLQWREWSTIPQQIPYYRK